MKKSMLKQIVGHICAILLYFVLTYYWVEDKNIRKSIISTIICIIAMIVANVINYLRNKN